MFGNARIIRFKFNILSSRDVEHHKHNIPHCDERVAGYWSMVVYLDGSVGDTVFFKQTLQQLDHTHKLEESKRITPQPGSVVIFPSRLMHASSSPWDGQDRVVANIVFSVV
jgi:ectoine hydroxylase-related dioxygenase (phytanoyl-CoA dioxygenase family)